MCNERYSHNRFVMMMADRCFLRLLWSNAQNFREKRSLKVQKNSIYKINISERERERKMKIYI